MEYIAVEGIDFIGKDTCIEKFKKEYGKKYDIYFAKEPGVTGVRKKIRKLLLDNKNDLDKMSEILLFSADRALLIKDIREKSPDIVISNRSLFSSMVYQSDDNIMPGKIYSLNRFACDYMIPNHVILFHIKDFDTFKKRMKKSNRKKDRIESRGAKYLYNLNNSYMDIIKNKSYRDLKKYYVDCTSNNVDEVYENFKNILLSIIKDYD